MLHHTSVYTAWEVGFGNENATGRFGSDEFLVTASRWNPQRIDRTWQTWTSAYGGYVAAVALAAAQAELPETTARAARFNLLRGVGLGALRTTASVARSGRRVGIVDSAVLEDDRAAVTCQLFVGRDGDVEVATVAPAPPPAVPAPDDCDLIAPQLDLVPFTQHVERRSADGRAPLREAGDMASLTMWVRWNETITDPLVAAVMGLDACPPALYATTTSPLVVPTVEMSVHFTDLTAPLGEWQLVNMTTEYASNGWCVDASRLWSQDGRLIASCRQTRLVLPAAE